MSSVVLDASALIAFLRREPGGEAVAPVLSAAAISAVNLSEVLAKSGTTPAEIEAAAAALLALPLRVVPFDGRHSLIAARMQPHTRAFGLSLGDRCCLALAAAEGLPALTTDRDWAKLDLGIDVRVLR